MNLGRRQILSYLALASAVRVAPTALSRPIAWRNWSGSQSCVPSAILAPKNLEELREIVALAKPGLRPVGAGHSFTALVPTAGEIVSLARISGLINYDADTLQASFYAGTQLSAMGGPLQDIGQALINMPDIDEQILAGAIATGTHGTGAHIGSMSSFVSGFELITATGDVLWCDADSNADLFAAGKVSLGVLGIISKIRVQNRRSYVSRRESWIMNWEDTVAQANDLAEKHRNFEFYYIPFSSRCLLHTHDEITEEKFSTPQQDENESTMDLKTLRDYIGWSDTLRGLSLQLIADTMERQVSVEASWLNYASERSVRFNEMEFHLPREAGLKALKDIKDLLESNHKEVFFPVEVRYVGKDDIWLSPFSGRDSMSIAIHRYFEEDYQAFFTAAEQIFLKYDGRPHWGKLNNLTAVDFAKIYPRWNNFAEVRREVDPGGKFLNPYLASLFGASA